ncbi:MAG: O-antigen ligase family protein [Gaiellaceae bacterium]
MKFSDQSSTVASNIRSTVEIRRIASTLPALLVPVSAFLAGGYYESTYSLLAAVTWLTLAAAAAVGLGRRPSGAFWALAAFGAWSALSALWGPAGPALRTVPLVALYAGALLAAEWVDGAALLHALLWGIVVVAAAGLVGKAAGVTDGSRLAWPVTYANDLGLLAVTSVVLAVGLRPRLWQAAAAVCAVCAVLTYSRSALLVGLACVLVLVLPRRGVLVLAAALVVLALVAARPLAARFAAPAPDSRDARRLVQLSGQGRAPLWRAAVREGRDHPILGGGAGSWNRAYIAQTGSLAGPANADSLPLETFAELGLVGLALLSAFLALALRGQERVVVVVVAAFAVASLVDWTWQPGRDAARAARGRERPEAGPAGSGCRGRAGRRGPRPGRRDGRPRRRRGSRRDREAPRACFPPAPVRRAAVGRRLARTRVPHRSGRADAPAARSPARGMPTGPAEPMNEQCPPHESNSPSSPPSRC